MALDIDLQREVSAFDEDGIQFAWDATSIKWVETCLQYYGYMREGWEPIRKSVHLIFGGHYATALERFAKYRAQGESYDDASLRVIHEALIDTWEHDLDEDGNRIPGTGKPWESDHNAKTRENLIRTIVWYLDQFRDDSMETVILPDGRPAVEYSFTIDIGKGLMFAGHIDRVVKYSGEYYVMDQKTTSYTITPRFFEGFNPDTQMSLYTLAGKIIYKLPIKGVVIDAAQIAVGFSRFERGFTFRTDSQLEEWMHDALYHIYQAQDASRKGYFPKNTQSCDKYGGCMFRSVCARSPEVRENFLRADFKKRPRWNPLAKR